MVYTALYLFVWI